MIVQASTSAATWATGEYFDLFMGAGGCGMFNALQLPGSGGTSQRLAVHRPRQYDQTGGET